MQSNIFNVMPTTDITNLSYKPVTNADQFTRYENQLYDPMNYYTSSGEFNLGLLNREYREEQLRRIAFYRDREKAKLVELDSQIQSKPNLLQLSVGQHLSNIKTTFFDIINDLTTKPLNIRILTVNNRLFYLGLLMIIIFLLYLVTKHLTMT